MKHKHSIGGQAVIDGVLMRNKDKIAIAVRTAEGKIKIKKEKVNVLPKWKIIKLPFIRGIFAAIEMTIIGIKALNYSANVSLSEEEEEELSGWQIFLTIFISLVFALALFKFTPLLLTTLLNPYLKILNNSLAFNALEGIIKIGIFLVYLYLISLMEDIKTIFRYHGAEHKTVNCYEHNKDLTIKNVRKYPTYHPRCGTSFIIFVIFISIFVYIFIPKSLPFWSKLLYRIILLPVIAGISYELLKITDRFNDNFIAKFFEAPGILIQKLTTKEPTDKQIEVAIKSIKAVI